MGIVNGESFNYGRKASDQDTSHTDLDVNPPGKFDTNERVALKDKWRYPEDSGYYKYIKWLAEQGKKFKKN